MYNHEGIRDFIISCLNVKVVGYNNLALGYLLLIIYVNVPKPSTSPNYLAYYPWNILPSNILLYFYIFNFLLRYFLTNYINFLWFASPNYCSNCLSCYWRFIIGFIILLNVLLYIVSIPLILYHIIDHMCFLQKPSKLELLPHNTNTADSTDSIRIDLIADTQYHISCRCCLICCKCVQFYRQWISKWS